MCDGKGAVGMTVGRGSRVSDWFREWHVPLRRFLARRRAGSTADIDDIAQEVFLRLLRYNRSELVDCPQAYLYKIAANVSAEWSSRSRRRMPHNSEWLNDLADTFDPEEELGGDAKNAEIERAINELPARFREILRLHFGEGMQREQIAVHMKLTRKIVKRDLARAYATLRITLDPDLVGCMIDPDSGRRRHES
jgi:RNA polymerase sigma factor (sigma-70 family)